MLGFRYADSFAPSGEAIGVGSGKCLDLPSWTNGDGTQAMINSCGTPATASQIWYYDPGLKQLYATNPADGSRHCLDAAGGHTASGTPVVISACQDSGIFSGTGVSSQKWTLDPAGAGIGKITNVKSGLVVDVTGASTGDGAGLQLMPYVSNPAQQWKLPSPLTGEIHGIGSGRCLDVPHGSTEASTQVQIYDCNGTLAQQWTYDPTSRALIYAKSPVDVPGRTPRQHHRGHGGADL